MSKRRVKETKTSKQVTARRRASTPTLKGYLRTFAVQIIVAAHRFVRAKNASLVADALPDAKSACRKRVLADKMEDALFAAVAEYEKADRAALIKRLAKRREELIDELLKKDTMSDDDEGCPKRGEK